MSNPTLSASHGLPTGLADREDLLRPLPRIGLGSLILILAIVGVYSWGIQGTDARPSELIRVSPTSSTSSFGASHPSSSCRARRLDCFNRSDSRQRQ